MSGLFTNLFIFLLATFLGLEVIRRVSPLLHTPLMSLTNAISAISLVGSLTILGRAENTLSITIGAIAVVASMTNVVSGFLITEPISFSACVPAFWTLTCESDRISMSFGTMFGRHVLSCLGAQ